MRYAALKILKLLPPDVLVPQHVEAVVQIAQQDGDGNVRRAALEILKLLRPDVLVPQHV